MRLAMKPGVSLQRDDALAERAVGEIARPRGERRVASAGPATISSSRM